MTGREKGLQLFDDPRLAFLFGEFGDPNMLLFMYFSFWYSFVNDYWYPKGGLMTLADILAEKFQEAGGEVKLSTTVDRIITQGKTAVGVETAEGERYFAEKIVNTGNPKRLLSEMIDPSIIPGKYGEKLKTAPVSYSMSTAFLGLDMDDGELARELKTTHTLYWRTYGFRGQQLRPGHPPQGDVHVHLVLHARQVPGPGRSRTPSSSRCARPITG